MNETINCVYCDKKLLSSSLVKHQKSKYCQRRREEVEQKDGEKKKHTLGQYFTTNHEHVLQNLNIPNDIINIIEPFAGNGDLLNFIEDKERHRITCYDIEPKHDFIIERDTLNNPPKYRNKFVLTNPPYLARNKSKDKTIFDKYDVNDLYKCFIKEIIDNRCVGGIIIIPLNFWSSIRKNDIKLRKDFLDVYKIVHLNIFEEQVFDDTTTTVCSFQFRLKNEDEDEENKMNISIYPSGKDIVVCLEDANNYTIGGEIYNLTQNSRYNVTRLTSKNRSKRNSNILVKCIDDNESNKINLSIVDDEEIYIDRTPNQSARTYATLVIEPSINLQRQELLVSQFNDFLEEFRLKYNSLFLCNYRESKDIARKRISFDLVYSIVKHLLLVEN
jgi:hypothetical protein